MTQPWTALIAARGGSKRFPGKNLAPLEGKPLYRHTVDQALAAGAAEVVISTDIGAILDASAAPNVRAFARPPELAGDHVAITDVILHALGAGGAAHDRIVLLQVTSPVRPQGAIAACLAAFEAAGAGPDMMAMSVTRVAESVQKYGTIEGGRFRAMRSNADCFRNAQSLPPVYRPNGSIYVFSAAGFRAFGGFPSEKIIPYEMAPEDSIDIDYAHDLKRIEDILAARRDRKD